MHIALLLCCSLTLAQDTAPTNAELVTAWSKLSDADRQDTIDWFTAECDNSKTFRTTLERYILVGTEGDPYDWPDAAAPPFYDAAKHCPAQPILRNFVSLKQRKWAAEADKLLGSWNERELVQAFRYDWARGTIVKLAKWDDPERIARAAAAGFSPQTDLVEAIVESQLDTGELRDVATAFGHAYSDRSGNALRTVTLYDAWSSGQTLEMPDVECLGIIHDLEDDWRTYVAPVAGRLQRPLYDRIGTHFAPLRRYRALRSSLARTYVQGTPPLSTGYDASIVRMHGLWELNVSDPAKLKDDLPSDKAWGEWWATRGAEADGSKDIVERAKARMKALDESRAWTRRTFHGILNEYGAFDPPKEAEKSDGGTPPKKGGGKR